MRRSSFLRSTSAFASATCRAGDSQVREQGQGQSACSQLSTGFSDLQQQDVQGSEHPLLVRSNDNLLSWTLAPATAPEEHSGWLICCFAAVGFPCLQHTAGTQVIPKLHAPTLLLVLHQIGLSHLQHRGNWRASGSQPCTLAPAPAAQASSAHCRHTAPGGSSRGATRAWYQHTLPKLRAA